MTDRTTSGDSALLEIVASAPFPDGSDPRCSLTGSDGATTTVPAFDRGAGAWTARFAPSSRGHHRYRFSSGEAGEVDVEDPPSAATALARHGAIRVAASGRHLEHQDGTPFLWLGDTWWFGFVDRISDEEFAALAKRRRDEGFSVVQIVAGIYPEASFPDPLGASAGRYPWLPDLSALDPAWWELADRRIAMLVDAGLVPCIVGAWSYHLEDFGDERMARHWREIIARWASYPVVFCVAGEAGLPPYDVVFTAVAPARMQALRDRWAALAYGIRARDPYRRLLTVHPCPAFHHWSSSDVFSDPAIVDLHLLQTGHADRLSLRDSLEALERETWRPPVRPVINSEVAYEGIAGGSGADLQRLLAWTHLLSGAAGHTYGAHGLWAMRDPADSGPGQMWGATGWREAAVLPGGRHVGLIASILEQLPWSSFIPHNDWIEPHAHVGCRELPYCAGVEGGTRVAYLPSAAFMPPSVGVSTALRTVTLAGLNPGAWTCKIVSPRDGTVEVKHAFEPDPAGRWTLPENTFLTALPTLEDWLLVVERGD